MEMSAKEKMNELIARFNANAFISENLPHLYWKIPEEETWDLNKSICLFLYSRLVAYLIAAEEIVDLEFHKIKCNLDTHTCYGNEEDEKEYSLRYLIEAAIDCFEQYFNESESEEAFSNEAIYAQKGLKIVSVIAPYLWW